MGTNKVRLKNGVDHHLGRPIHRSNFGASIHGVDHCSRKNSDYVDAAFWQGTIESKKRMWHSMYFASFGHPPIISYVVFSFPPVNLHQGIATVEDGIATLFGALDLGQPGSYLHPQIPHPLLLHPLPGFNPPPWLSKWVVAPHP